MEPENCGVHAGEDGYQPVSPRDVRRFVSQHYLELGPVPPPPANEKQNAGARHPIVSGTETAFDSPSVAPEISTGGLSIGVLHFTSLRGRKYASTSLPSRKAAPRT